MESLWPWLAVAGLGALHGLSPANGWMFAAACGVRARDSSQARRALPFIAIGHVTSIAIVACAFTQGLSMNSTLVQSLAGALLIGAASYRVLRVSTWCGPVSEQTGHAGIALWSFLMATAHGSGLMLVPALLPMCMSNSPARAITASGSLGLALAAVAVHMTVMLITTGIVATGVCRGVNRHPRLLTGSAPRQAWTATLALTGLLLMMLRR